MVPPVANPDRIGGVRPVQISATSAMPDTMPPMLAARAMIDAMLTGTPLLSLPDPIELPGPKPRVTTRIIDATSAPGGLSMSMSGYTPTPEPIGGGVESSGEGVEPVGGVDGGGASGGKPGGAGGGSEGGVRLMGGRLVPPRGNKIWIG